MTECEYWDLDEFGYEVCNLHWGECLYGESLECPTECDICGTEVEDYDYHMEKVHGIISVDEILEKEANDGE